MLIKLTPGSFSLDVLLFLFLYFEQLVSWVLHFNTLLLLLLGKNLFPDCNFNCDCLEAVDFLQTFLSDGFANILKESLCKKTEKNLQQEQGYNLSHNAFHQLMFVI